MLALVHYGLQGLHPRTLFSLHQWTAVEKKLSHLEIVSRNAILVLTFYLPIYLYC